MTGAGGLHRPPPAAALVAEGAEVVGIDVSPAAAERIADAGAESADRRRHRPRRGARRRSTGADLVVHTAAYVHEWGDMEEFVRVNVGGTANVLDAAATRAPSASSISARSSSTATTTRREQDEAPFRRAYGIPYIDTKSASDRLARRRGAVVIRPGDVYGPGSIPWIVRPLELARRAGSPSRRRATA